MGNPYIGISWVYKPPLLGPWVYPLPLGNNGCLDPSKWIGMPTKSDICWIFENNIMALLKWLQNRNEPLKKQLGMCCQVVVQSFKKLTCSRCCTCTTLHIWVPAAKIPKIPNLTTALLSNFSAFDFPPTLRSKKPSSWSDFSLLASAKRIAAWHHDTTVIFENGPDCFLGGWKVELPRRWFKNPTVSFSLWVAILVFQFLWNHILRSKQVGGKLFELESSILPDQIYPPTKSWQWHSQLFGPIKHWPSLKLVDESMQKKD